MSISRLMQMGAAGAGGGVLAIEDVFSTYLYTGNGSTQTITNDIDLAGEGGLVWIKERGGVNKHVLTDTVRGATKELTSSETAAEITIVNGLTAFNSTGFDLGSRAAYNTASDTYASWTFRKAPRFFDVVTYTGDGTVRQIPHNLGVEPGMIVVKRRDSSGTSWYVWHNTFSATEGLALELTSAKFTGRTWWGNTLPTAANFTVGGSAGENASGGTYVAYLFAHDPLGPSGDGSDGLIACGSYTGNGSATGPEIDLGWEPQWVMIKNASGSGPWVMLDNMRGWPVTNDTTYTDHMLWANTSDAEYTTVKRANITSTGFQIRQSNSQVNTSGANYIYIAIRRGPMRQPESGTDVFAVATPNSTNSPRYSAPFTVDGVFEHFRDGGSAGRPRWAARLTGARYLSSTRTSSEAPSTEWDFAFNEGYMTAVRNTTSWVSGMWRRAPGFFDVVAYTGDGVAGRTVSHNLGVVPEMMIVKRRDSGSWLVYHAGTAIDPETDYLILNATNGVADNATMWNDTAPSDTVFTLGSSASTNASGSPHIAYLFATLPGVSKVGSYIGNGTSQTIDCGFTSGARFILIKRTDSTGDWYVWDTARGIVAANDPHLSLNTTAAEVTTDDSVDPDSSGFIVNQVAATNINVSSANYIFYAVS